MLQSLVSDCDAVLQPCVGECTAVKEARRQRICQHSSLAGSLWRRSHACEKTGSNQRRLSSRGTLQPPLGDCDLVAGRGTLRDIWKSFSTRLLQKIKSEIWADILQMSVKWDNWARPQPDAGTEPRAVICCIDLWTTVFYWHMVTDVSLCEHLTQKRWSSLWSTPGDFAHHPWAIHYFYY